MDMTVKEALIAARAKIADPANWTQNMASRDARGLFAPSRSERAVCWCSVSALGISCGRDDDLFWKADTALSKAMGMAPHIFNDTHTHAEVLAKFDEAIAAQGGE